VLHLLGVLFEYLKMDGTTNPKAILTFSFSPFDGAMQLTETLQGQWHQH
jgi:hypothetical protein